MKRRDYCDILLSLPETAEKLEMIITDGEGAGEKALFADGKPAACTAGGEARSFFESAAAEICGSGNLCGSGVFRRGGRTVFYECLNRVPRLVICGAGHVGLALCRMASLTGLATIVIEDRPEYADLAQKAGAGQVICAPFEEALTGLKSDEGTCYVLVTRSHQHGMEILRVILRKPRLYAGMMSSRTRASGTRETLLREGFPEADIDSIHMPVGLEIGAATPQEIAVSILAQLISVIRARGTGDGYSPDILDALCSLPDPSDPGRPRAVLATIVKKEGEAPRDPGTRMLVLPDGRQRGTIGGGYAEDMIRRAALRMLKETAPRPQAGSRDPSSFSFLQINMPSGGSRQAAGEKKPAIYTDESMICGGQITVLLEGI